MSRDWTVLLWREKTWGERAQTAISFVLALVVCLGGFLAVILFVLAPMIDNSDRRRSEHDRCLKNATNGYEIK